MASKKNDSRPWADGPWALIETPSLKSNTASHEAIHIANEMAFAHNAMIRGLNTLYHQADLSETQDIVDYLFFLRSWATWINHHHVSEEEKVFPQFEKVIGKPNVLNANIEEHHTFQPILQQLLDYADTKPEDYQASNVRGLIEQMAPSFCEHLANEIPTLLNLASYDGPSLLKVWKRFEAEAGKQDKFVVPPMVLGLRDVTFEGGNNWPNMPPLATHIVHYILARKHAGAWRFLPSDAWGNPRPLRFATPRVDPVVE